MSEEPATTKPLKELEKTAKSEKPALSTRFLLWLGSSNSEELSATQLIVRHGLFGIILLVVTYFTSVGIVKTCTDWYNRHIPDVTIQSLQPEPIQSSEYYLPTFPAQPAPPAPPVHHDFPVKLSHSSQPTMMVVSPDKVKVVRFTQSGKPEIVEEWGELFPTDHTDKPKYWQKGYNRYNRNNYNLSVKTK